MRKYILLVFYTVFCYVCNADIEIKSMSLHANDGLANNTVRSFYQDSKGFIWMSTLDGLCRYDGNSFLTIRPDKEQEISLSDQRVTNIKEDKNGFLWITTTPELYSCYDLKHECFVDYTGNGDINNRYSNMLIANNSDVWLWHNGNGARCIKYENGEFSSCVYTKEKENISDNRVSFVYEDMQNGIWIGTQNGLMLVADNNVRIIDNTKDYRFISSDNRNGIFFITRKNEIYRFNRNTGKTEFVTICPTVKNSTTPTGCIFHKNSLIILTTEGLFTYDTDNHTINSDSKFFNDNPMSGEIIIDNKGHYWIYNHSGKIWYLHNEKDEAQRFTLIPEDKIGYVDFERYSIIHDSRDIIWISTYGNGLFAYHTHEEKMYHYTANIDGSSPVGSDFLHSVFEDHSGAIWVGTDHAGISILTFMLEDIRRIYPEDKQLMDRSNTIRMVRKAQNGNIFVGTRKGRVYEYDGEMKRKLSSTYYPSSIYDLKTDAKGRTWLGSRGKGISVDGKWYQHNPEDKFSLSNDNVFFMYEDTRHRMWITTFGGGLNLAIEEKNTFYFRHFFNNYYTQSQIRVVGEDKNGMLWIGSDDGVYVFNPDSLIDEPDKYYHYTYQNSKLKSNDIRAIICDSKGYIWIGTAAGITRCKPENNYNDIYIESYTNEDGLINNNTQALVEDRFGNIWITTEYGISRYLTTNGTFENYTFSIDGLGNAYCEGSACMNNLGELIFGSNHGMIIIDPSVIKKTSFLSSIVFTNLKVNGTNINAGDHKAPIPASIAYSDNIKLHHTQNSFEIDFSTFNFAEQHNIKYSYILEEYDKDWSSATGNNSALYKNIPPGKYTLKVKVSNNSGSWEARQAMMNIEIKPPFWQTTPAYFLYCLIIVGILYISFRITRNFARLNNKIELEKQLTNFKLVFFTNISHEFRTPLTLIQGGLEKIEQKADLLPKELITPLHIMEKSTQRLLRLINQLLEFRKMQNDKLALSLEETDVNAFLKEIFYSFKDTAQSKNIDFRFISSPDNYKMFIDKEKLDKIAYNLLSNAFKYTPSKGKVRLSVNTDPATNCLQIQVTDSGVGIPKEKQNDLFKRFMQSRFASGSIGIGLHLTYELVNVHKGKISFNENEGGGSVFTVTLPLDSAVYKDNDFLIPDNILMQKVSHAVINEKKTIKAASDTSIENHPINTTYKILIIEDDSDVLSFINQELSIYFKTDTAENGAIGLEKARTADYDLIVCDVLMPEMDGFTVTRNLKSDFATSHIPVILITALSMQENRIEGYESGADAYITKPFSIKLLLARIFKLMEQREILRTKYSSEPGILNIPVCTNNKDKEFAEKLNLTLEKNITNPGFSVDDFAHMMKVGRTVFYKKVKGITGYSPNEYMRIIRMKKAAELLQNSDLTVTEVAYKTGINDPFYFSKCFKAQFGISPSTYQKGGYVHRKDKTIQTESNK